MRHPTQGCVQPNIDQIAEPGNRVFWHHDTTCGEYHNVEGET